MRATRIQAFRRSVANYKKQTCIMGCLHCADMDESGVTLSLFYE